MPPTVGAPPAPQHQSIDWPCRTAAYVHAPLTDDLLNAATPMLTGEELMTGADRRAGPPRCRLARRRGGGPGRGADAHHRRMPGQTPRTRFRIGAVSQIRFGGQGCGDDAFAAGCAVGDVSFDVAVLKRNVWIWKARSRKDTFPPSWATSAIGRSSRSVSTTDATGNAGRTTVAAWPPSDSYNRTITSPERSSASLIASMTAASPSVMTSGSGSAAAPPLTVRSGGRLDGGSDPLVQDPFDPVFDDGAVVVHRVADPSVWIQANSGWSAEHRSIGCAGPSGCRRRRGRARAAQGGLRHPPGPAGRRRSAASSRLPPAIMGGCNAEREAGAISYLRDLWARGRTGVCSPGNIWVGSIIIIDGGPASGLNNTPLR